MLRKIFFTFSSKVFITIINFLVILITARFLGAEGRGIIGLLVLGITINLLVSNVFGGAAIAYLVPRVEIFRLITPAYSWSVLSTMVVSAVLMFTHLIPSGYGLHLFFLSLLQSFYNIHLNVLVGKGLIKENNLANTLQLVVLFVVIVFMIFILENKTIDSYLYALYSSLVFSFLLSMFFLRDEVRLFPVKEWWSLWETILKNGYIIQIASIAQLLNYRLSYFLLDHFSLPGSEGKKLVGIYSTAVTIAESAWLIGRSMGLIQYTHIVKGSDTLETRVLTMRFGKISFLLTLFFLLPVILLPPVFYHQVFGYEFDAISSILIFLFPGILSFGMALMYSNYFAGLGLNKINLTGSLTGLVVTLCLGIFLVPNWGMKGAAITASVSYLATSIYLWVTFIRRTGLGWKEMIPDKKDFILLKLELKKKLSGKSD